MTIFPMHDWAALRDRHAPCDELTLRAAPTGIGKAIARRLASQGLSVVLVALPNADLDATHEELTMDFPQSEFRTVRVASVGPYLRSPSFAAGH